MENDKRERLLAKMDSTVIDLPAFDRFTYDNARRLGWRFVVDFAMQINRRNKLPDEIRDVCREILEEGK